MGGSMMMTMDAEQYEDSYGGAYDEHYGDQSYGSEEGAGQDTRAQGKYFGPSGVRALPLAAGINVGGHYFRYWSERSACAALGCWNTHRWPLF